VGLAALLRRKHLGEIGNAQSLAAGRVEQRGERPPAVGASEVDDYHFAPMEATPASQVLPVRAQHGLLTRSSERFAQREPSAREVVPR
jgi:hypothetical protein